MTRIGAAALAALWLAGCGIYGPPERATKPAPSPGEPQSEQRADECPQPEQGQ